MTLNEAFYADVMVAGVNAHAAERSSHPGDGRRGQRDGEEVREILQKTHIAVPSEGPSKKVSHRRKLENRHRRIERNESGFC